MGNVIGRPVFSVPKLGILADVLSGRREKIMYAGIIIILLLLLFLGDMVFQKDKRLDGTEKMKILEKILKIIATILFIVVVFADRSIYRIKSNGIQKCMKLIQRVWHPKFRTKVSFCKGNRCI